MKKVYLSIFTLFNVFAQRVNITLEPVASLNKSLNEVNVNHKFVFNLIDKPNGIYFLKVYFKDRKTNNIETHRILKTN